jgi:hypothetical protein
LLDSVPGDPGQVSGRFEYEHEHEHEYEYEYEYEEAGAGLLRSHGTSQLDSSMCGQVHLR